MTLTAGRLSGNDIGRVIRIRVREATVIEDEISGLFSEGDHTYIRFRHVMPTGIDLMFNVLGSGSFQLNHDSEIEAV